MMRRLVAALLCVSLLFSGCSFSLNVPFGSIEYSRPDTAKLLEKIAEVDEYIQNSTDFKGKMNKYAELNNQIGLLNTMNTYAYIKNSVDQSDETYKAEVDFYNENYSEVMTKFNLLMKDLVETSTDDELGQYFTPYQIWQIKLGAKLYSDEMTEDLNRVSQIEAEYWDIISEMGIDPDEAVDPDELGGYDKADGGAEERLGKLYLELIERGNSLGKAAGFSGGAEYFYGGYMRDYSPAEMLALCDGIKAYIIPAIKNGVLNASYVEPISMLDETNAYDRITEFLSDKNADFGEAIEFMKEYELSDTTVSPNKKASSFVTLLTSYNEPYMVVSLDGGYDSLSTFVHEFGHFYDNYSSCKYYEPTSSTIEMSEFFALSLEMILSPSLNRFMENDIGKTSVRQSMMIDTLYNNLIFQAALEEFQISVFSDPPETTDEISKRFGEVMASYGMSGLDSDYWIYVHHLFIAPFYTGGYAVSMMNVLEIWNTSLKSEQSAINQYMSLTRSSRDYSYRDFMYANSLNDPFDESFIMDMAGKLEDYFD